MRFVLLLFSSLLRILQSADGGPHCERDPVLISALHLLAAKASKWIYEPKKFPIPLSFNISGKIVTIETTERVFIIADDNEQAQKGTLVANLIHGTCNFRVFVLSFRGTVTAQDWLANLGAIREKSQYAKMGIDVHSGWNAMVSEPQYAKKFLEAIESNAQDLDRVLICGHSMGGALAQISALRAYQQAQQLDPGRVRDLLTDRLVCITYASTSPFAPTVDVDKKVLAWLRKHTFNYINSNDIVPRIPCAVDFVRGFLEKAATVTVAIPYTGGIAGKNMDPAKLLQTLEDATPTLKYYQTTSFTYFMTYDRTWLKGTDPNTTEFQTLIKQKQTELRIRRDIWEEVGNQIAGGLVSALTDHSMDIYCELVFKSKNAQDHIHGYGTYLKILSDGVVLGKGIKIWSDGSRYEGDFVGDQVTGKGFFAAADGSMYSGDFSQSLFHGKGTLWGSDGKLEYDGDWFENLKHGKGIDLKNGEHYEGDWIHHKRHGKGKCTVDDGRFYEGDWQKGKRHGNGIYKEPDGSSYDGEWQNDKRHGVGTYTSPTGESYTQVWKYGKKQAEQKQESSQRHAEL